MIERILETYRISTYDFRNYACLQDPLIDLFEEWVDYYRLKWAIARSLMPATILEIGVRYGYSAQAFLNANPKSRFVGIDADLPAFGGYPGALKWAKQSLDNFDVTLYCQNSQNLTRLPGGIYDLIHIDGQQDGDGTFHDLELALRQARYILVDGYQWTRENFLSANEWLWLNKMAVESAIIIPGYAGELLISTKLDKTSAINMNIESSLPLAQTYDSYYYLNDCGGCVEWKRSRGAVIDPRLQSVADIGVTLGPPSKVLDLGAGRGELTRYFAQQGAQVKAIDYSIDAIGLIEKTLETNQDNLREKVDIIHDTVLNQNIYNGDYDLAVAADLIEHLSYTENDALYKLVSSSLKANKGTFIIHTAPNLWLYHYEHPRQQEAAKKAGFWLPRTRRTWYERLMHINEQNPRVLKRQLSCHFPYILIWFANSADLGGSLLKNYRISDMRQAASLFAVASYKPIDLNAIKSAFIMEELSPEQASKITLHIACVPHTMEVGGQYKVKVSLYNGSDRLLSSRQPYPLHLSYHWKDQASGSTVIYDGLRSPLSPPCPPDCVKDYRMDISAPKDIGTYLLKILPVQEMVRWHEEAIEKEFVVHVVDKALLHKSAEGR